MANGPAALIFASLKATPHWITSMRKSYSKHAQRESLGGDAPADEPPFTIYAAPTVDTLEDAPYRPQLSSPAPSLHHSEDADKSRMSQREATTSRSDISPTRPRKQQASSTPLSRSSAVQYPPSVSPSSSSKAKTPSKPSRLPPRQARSVGKKRAPRDFQHEEDTMTVTARMIDLATRTAFEPIQPVSIEQWQSTAAHAGEVRNTNMNKRLSPSLQHLELLHQMYDITSIRQLAFSPSVGLESDIFVPWDEDLDGANTATKRRRRWGKSKRDGRYRSIDPVKAAASGLPSHPPTLSNQKHRLPMRSDVGFPNASEQEIRIKQLEISRETEWEEASPRLVVLVTCDDIGTAVHDDPPSGILLQQKKWNGGGLEGIPLAGKELMMAKERNVRFFEHTGEGPQKHFHKWKPNTNSMLAPPLEAAYSSTLGWRPRPFNDQLPGIVHCLACPLSVQFDIGNIEPMVGSLALYSLPKDPTQKGAYGKMSEEFYFPVGMWKGCVSLEAARTLKGEIDVDMVQAWHGRKHKGLFSYDPTAIPWGRASLHLVMQIYKVPHWNAAAPYLASKGRKKGFRSRIKGTIGKPGKSDDDDAEVAIAQSRSNVTFDTVGTQFLTPLCFGVTPLFPRKVVEVMNDNAEEGIFSLEDVKLSWPNGAIEEVQLYAFPSPNWSQEEFLQCVSTVADEKFGADLHLDRSRSPVNEGHAKRNLSSGDISFTTESTSESGLGLEDISTDETFKTSASSNSIATMKGDDSRVSLKSYLKRASTRSVSSTKLRTNGGLPHLDIIAGTATLFTSTVGNDFTQSMLNTPIELLDSHSGGGIHALPRLLVDVTGDCAIMINPSAAKVSSIVPTNGFEAGRRRSDLVRLPLSSTPSGYADASEVRQLLYLPPRLEKEYDVDPPSSLRSCLNLLYMYPRLLRVAQDGDKTEAVSSRGHGRQSKKEALSYSVRIQLVQSSVELNEATGQIETSQVTLTSMHNPAPWSGPQMLQAVYTKIDDACMGKHAQHNLDNGGIPMRDEIKMRLPMILDGSYFLHFTLFSVKFNDDSGMHDPNGRGGGLAVNALAETTIPLSTSSNREPTSGVRVATVIPNGCHRIRIGKYQLQLETRLVSSIHVYDPTVAIVLRDFPYAKERNDAAAIEDKFKELSLVPSRSIVGKSPSAEPLDDMKVPFHRMLARASGSAIMANFPVLFHMHLCNIVNHATGNLNSSQDDAERRRKFAMDNMVSLLELFRKVKTKLLSETGYESSGRVDIFVKNFIDTFDETSMLRARDGSHVVDEQADTGADGTSSEKSRFSSSVATPQKNSVPSVDGGDDDDSDEGEKVDGATIISLKRNDHSHLKGTSTFNASAAPFSRVAFGASKTDRMRIEAELFHGNNRFTQLFDDDVTVATNLHHVATAMTEEGFIRKGDVGRNALNPVEDDSSHAGSEDSFFVQSPHRQSTPGSPAQGSLRESGFVKRVRTAAQVFIAPCMAPSLSAVLNSGTRVSPKGASDETDSFKDRMTSALKSNADPSVVDRLNCSSEKDREATHLHVYPGSDVEEKASYQNTVANPDPGIKQSILRGEDNVRNLSFANLDPEYKQGSDLNSTPFVYEVVMVLWLRSFLDQISAKDEGVDSDGSAGESDPSKRYSVLLHSSKADSTASQTKPLLLFHSYTDMLLPICLKSFLLRCTSAVPANSPSVRIGLDSGHMKVLVPFVEMLTHSLVGEALSGPSSGGESDLVLLRALSRAQMVLEFLVGLASILHPHYMAELIWKHFRMLRECEIAPETRNRTGFAWNEDSLHRARCSRQLRIRSAERLACMPNFVALNYPLRYREEMRRTKRQATSWCTQDVEPESGFHYAKSICPYPDGRDRLPESGWLASLLASECLSISSLSCEAVVAEAIANVETTPKSKSISSPLAQRPGVSLKRNDLLRFQSTAIHAVTCVYELMLRRHAMDARFQKDQARSRIAALFAPAILENSLRSTRWLARMEATHKVRATWLLCFVYIIQEAPETLLRDFMRSCCSPPEFQVHRLIRVLRLSSATFQCFIEQPQHNSSGSVLSEGLTPWLLQESYNTISAAANMLVDESATSMPISAFPQEETKMTQGILDLLLHVLTSPQSAVTHLRTVGCAIQTLNKLGIDNFLEAGTGSIQHWVRVMLTLMNSVSLSVRSIAVDFVVSLLGATFNSKGNIDEIGIIFATVMPEVVAREIALYSVNGLIKSIDNVECAVWPLRRALADVEEANPLDDDRVDPQLSPLLSTLCRACQAIIDGVLIELRLKGSGCNIVGSEVPVQPREVTIFDADEESLYEASSFFLPETAPLQRLRWLFTLTCLHEAKNQWVEAAETLVLCARTASDAIPHIKSVWRPSRFVLWHDTRRSLWLSTVGKEMGHPDRGHEQVMQFADSFLELPIFLGDARTKMPGPKLQQPTVQGICNILTSSTKRAASNYLKEDGLGELALIRLEALLQLVMHDIDDHNARSLARGKNNSFAARKRMSEEVAALRRVSACLNGELTKLAEKLMLDAEGEKKATGRLSPRKLTSQVNVFRRQYYVRVLISGKKTQRFEESTTIPTFLEWNNPCVCRVPRRIIESVIASETRDSRRIEERICVEFGTALRDALVPEATSLMFRTGGQVDDAINNSLDANTTYLDVSMVHMDLSTANGNQLDDVSASRQSKHFFYRKLSSATCEPPPPPTLTGKNRSVPELLPDPFSYLVELSVAHPFPCALSRQRTLLTSELLADNPNEL